MREYGTGTCKVCGETFKKKIHNATVCDKSECREAADRERVKRHYERKKEYYREYARKYYHANKDKVAGQTKRNRAVRAEQFRRRYALHYKSKGGTPRMERKIFWTGSDLQHSTPEQFEKAVNQIVSGLSAFVGVK